MVSTFNQTHGRGYTSNVWQSGENQNLTFSFLVVDELNIQKDLPILNMWVAISILSVLSKWQIKASIKWPNDMMVKGKKIGGILIQSKISNNRIKFVVVGIGLNIYQTNFTDLPKASSIIHAYPDFDKPLNDCLLEMLCYLENDYKTFNPENYAYIISTYHQHLFKKDQVASYEYNGVQCNGILRKINEEGNAEIEIENQGLMTFRHKEIKLNY